MPKGKPYLMSGYGGIKKPTGANPLKLTNGVTGNDLVKKIRLGKRGF